MDQEGGCYCGAVRYRVTQTPTLKAQCHCRACSYFSGGGPNYFMLIPAEGFRYTTDMPARFRRADLERAVTREFCPDCGTHILSRRPGLSEVVLKVGTLDDPTVFGGPRIAIFCEEALPWHIVPEGVLRFAELP